MAGSNKLTEAAVKQAKPKEKTYKLTDGGGLYLEVMPNGSRYWRLKYRYAGKEKRLALGVYNTVTLSSARDKARAAKTVLADGIDPSDQKRQGKLAKKTAASNTFEAVALEWFELKKPKWSESSIVRTKSQLETKLFPWLGKRPVNEITAQELLAVLKRIEAKGTLETAHRVKYTAGQIFRFAIVTNRATNNPAPNLTDALATPIEKNFAAIIEPAELGKLLLAMDGYMGTPTVRAALLLSPLFFVRPGELRQIEWQEVNLDDGYIEIPAERMKKRKAHVIPLCRQALAILRELQPITGNGRYVFPSARGAGRPLSENGVRSALRTMGYTNEQMTPHGFRATARTILDERLGFSVDLIEHQSARKVRDAMGTSYNRTKFLDARTEMMQAWADYLDVLRATARGENVISGGFNKTA